MASISTSLAPVMYFEITTGCSLETTAAVFRKRSRSSSVVTTRIAAPEST